MYGLYCQRETDQIGVEDLLRLSMGSYNLQICGYPENCHLWRTEKSVRTTAGSGVRES